VAPGTEYVCYQSWTLAMPAIGMLMVGTAVLVASIGWMIIQYAVLNDVENKVFASLGGIFTLLAVVTTTLSPSVPACNTLSLSTSRRGLQVAQRRLSA